ncbi:MAG: twin-arginine translocase subunit TatC [Paludibacter sp.]|nr:twin-arginine translocase subunit TatC [Paludibacter sp.]
MNFFKGKDDTSIATFWEHLESLRWVIMRVMIVLIVLLIVVFGNKEFIFSKLIFSSLNSDFWLYTSLCRLAELLAFPALCPGYFNIQLININLSGQFMAHISTSFTIGLLLAVPYLLYEIWKFIYPALYPNEKKSTGFIFLISSLLFYTGAAVSYYVIFPLTIRFLGTYTVSELVPNQISVQSYLSTFFILIFSLGIMFEMPVLAYFLSKIGIITKQTLRAGRKYALVIILIIAAIITPTTDPFTMTVVALPIYLLYEVSILVCRNKTKH